MSYDEVHLIPKLKDYFRILRQCFLSPGQTGSTLIMFKREVLLSYRLLFGQSRKSRHYFNNVERKSVAKFKNQYDPFLDVLCGKPNGKSVRDLPSELWPNSSLDHNGWLLE